MSRRLDRVNDLLRDELSELIRREMNDPRLSGLVTITEVKTSVDLQHAQVYVSVLSTPEEKASVAKALDSARGFLWRELRKRLSLRHIPELRFILDASLERGARLQELIYRLHSEGSPKSG